VARVSRSTLALAALASVAVPGLDPVAVGPTAQGGPDFDAAVLTGTDGRRWVARAPRRPAAAAAVDTEERLLPRLAPLLPVPVPVPVGHCRLKEGGRCVVSAYLPGTPLDAGTLDAGAPLAAEVGRVVGALHDVDPQVFEEAGVPVYEADEYRLRRLSDVDRAAATGAVPAVLLARWEHALEQVAHWRFVPTPVHGDLAGDHVLQHDGRVSAILHWGEARVADPGDDLAWVVAGAPADALNTVLEAYAMARGDRPDPHLAERARLAGELSLARWLLGGVAADDSSVVDQATGALTRLAERTSAADDDVVPG
jgi:macrolide phosphotransferase